MICTTLVHYEIAALLGEGGVGEVWCALDTELGRELESDRERAARCEREAYTPASLQHANVASIHVYEDVEGVRFLALALVDGEPANVKMGPQRAVSDVSDSVIP